MKHYRPLAWMMAIAIASMTMTACSSNEYESEDPFTTDPVEKATLYVCGVNESGTRSVGDEQDVLFTEDDIEWFNITTREIKFFDKQNGDAESNDNEKPLYMRLLPYREIKFYLGDNALFVVSSYVTDVLSQVFPNLVLHYDMVTHPSQGHYYLRDCYPPQFIDTEEVQANIKKNAGQWELFTYYLESKGKLRR